MTPPAVTCPSCGHAIPPDVQFCPECGAIVTRDPVGKRVDRLDQPFEVPPSLEPAPPGSAPPSSRTALVVGAATLFVAVALAFFFWPSSKPSSIPVPGEPAVQPTAASVAAAPSPIPTPRPGVPTPVAAKPAPPLPEPARRAEESARPPETAAGESRRAERGAREASTAPPPSEPGAESERHASRERSRPEFGEPRWYRMRFRAPLFAEPSETAAVVTRLPEGTRIRVTRQVDGFLAVESTTGKAPGYVSRDDAIPESTAGAR